MATPADKINTDKLSEAMTRKPILMPDNMIEAVERLAAQASQKEHRQVSFAEIVRRAVQHYDPSSVEPDDELNKAILENIVSTTKDTIAQIRKLNRKLDKSDKERRHGHD